LCSRIKVSACSVVFVWSSFVTSMRSGDLGSTSVANPSQSVKIPITALGLWSRKTPKTVGKMPAESVQIGAMSNLFGSHSFDVTPCCSGVAPMIIDAQLGLLTSGITARA
jgi:hypothetical protein